MQLFYNPTLEQSSQHLRLDKVESRHIVRVLRKKIGDIIFITNGKGLLFKGSLTLANEKHCELEILSVEEKTRPPYTVHLAIAPTKNNDRFEWFLEKATEIGIDQITPLLCEHSERKVIKPERFERIIESAMKQSLHVYMPALHPLTTFQDFIRSHQGENHFIAHCEEKEKSPFYTSLQTGQSVVICIGPEGDFSPQEIQNALAAKYRPVSLGNTRLRTETAGVVATHTIALKNE